MIKDHVIAARQGPEALEALIKRLRKVDPDAVLDLTGAKLTFAKLMGADLTGAELMGAELKGADLTGAELMGADLTGAKLNQPVLMIETVTGINTAWGLTGLAAAVAAKKS